MPPAMPAKDMSDLNAEHLDFNDGLRESGHFLTAEALEPAKASACVRVRGGKASVTDGPFTESKELVAGFWILTVKSREEVETWMKKAPFGKPPFDPTDEIEVRRIFELEDFAEGTVSDEIRTQEETWREKSGYA